MGVYVVSGNEYLCLISLPHQGLLSTELQLLFFFLKTYHISHSGKSLTTRGADHDRHDVVVAPDDDAADGRWMGEEQETGEGGEEEEEDSVKMTCQKIVKDDGNRTQIVMRVNFDWSVRHKICFKKKLFPVSNFVRLKLFLFQICQIQLISK